MHAVFTLLSRPRVVVVTGCVYILGQLGMTQLVRDIGPALFQLQVTTDWTRFQAIQSTWTETQWAQYHAHFTVDFLFPWAYGLFLTCWMLRHTLHTSYWPKWRRVIWIPASTAVADCIENAIHMHLLTLPSNVPLWVSISGWVSRYKWGVAALIVVCCLIREAQRGLQARHRP